METSIKNNNVYFELTDQQAKEVTSLKFPVYGNDSEMRLRTMPKQIKEGGKYLLLYGSEAALRSDWGALGFDEMIKMCDEMTFEELLETLKD